MQVSHHKFKKLGRVAQARVSKKIRKLIREGYPQKQAIRIAFEYERKHKLGPRGGKKNPLPFLLIPGLEMTKSYRHKKNPDDIVTNPLTLKLLKIIKDGRGNLNNLEIYNTLKTDSNFSRLKHNSVYGDLKNLRLTGYIDRDSHLCYRITAQGEEALSKAPNVRRKNPIADKDLAPALAWLFYLRSFPNLWNNCPKNILDALRTEGFWEVDGITEKGERFLYKACAEQGEN